MSPDPDGDLARLRAVCLTFPHTAEKLSEALLTDADPDLYDLPPYMAPTGWIAIRTNAPATDRAYIAGRAGTSWRAVAPRRLVELLPA